MSRRLLWVPFTLAAIAGAQTKPSAPPQQAVVDRYCVGCHNEKLKNGGVALDSPMIDNSVWEKVLRKVRTGEMPPAGLPHPEPAVLKSFTASVESALDQAAATNPNPGRPAIHRLNRAEYSNAVRDLLALDIDPGSTLPADDSGYGFDNIGDVLSVSPILLERYMSMGRKISRFAVGDPTLQPTVEQFSMQRGVRQDDRASEDLPFGSRGGMALPYHFPLDAEYSIRVHVRLAGAGARSGASALPPQLDLRLDGARVKLFDVPAGKPEQADSEQGLFDVRIPVKAGTRLIAATFMKEVFEPEGLLPQIPNGARPVVGPAGPSLDYIRIGGPFNPTGVGETPSRARIFVCRPNTAKEEAPCARQVLSTLARRAYRRPVTDADMRPLLTFYETGRRKGNFEAGIEMALRRMLVSPDFLFRVERDPPAATPGGMYRINPFELASRLSFFLWSSIPDDELLQLAERGKLNDQKVLEQQVRRMLADSRSKALVTNFAGQWLYLRNLSKIRPDPDAFPDFDESLRQAFQRETELFFATVLREDRSVVDLLDANFTFLNERLARHYQIPNIHGSQFRRVSLAGSERGGLLTQGSILTVTSYPTRTSPVLRGKWILENLLGTPPPPPPANVPDLKDKTDDGKLLSLRQQMEKHRADPTCAGCHSRMDPLGFALENYDATGKWRTHDAKADTDIDTSGVLPDGTRFQGPAGLKTILVSHREEFAATATEKLLTYALGRGLEYYDKPAVRAITRDAARDDYRLSALLMAIIKSTPFQMRRSSDQ